MDLTTRCPECSIEFPVSLQQLQLRKGYVRCANCAHIFDAYEAVVPSAGAESSVSRAATPTASAPAEPKPSSAEPEFSAAQSHISSDGPHFVVSATKAQPASSRAEPNVSIRVRGTASEPGTFTARDSGPGLSE